MRNTTLATVAIAIGLLACADNNTPTGIGEPELPAFAVAATPPLFQDDFESGTLASWDDGANSTLHRIITDATLARSGSRLLEVTYPAAGNGSWLTKFILPGYQSVHVSYWVRYPSTWRGGSYLLGAYGSTAANPWAAHGKAGVCPTGSDYFSSFVFADDGDPGPLRFYTYHLNMPRSGTQCWGDEGASNLYTGSGLLSRDAWHRVEFFVQANTPGVADGLQRMWIDGTLRGEWTGLRFRNTSNLVITSIQLALYSAATVAQTQKMYVDDVVVTQVPPGAIASIEVAPATATLGVGATTQLVATARDAAGAAVPATFTWSSSNPSAVGVTLSGLATAIAAGTADVSATASGISGRSTITVSGVPSGAPVASITITPTSGSLAVGQSLQFVATTRDAAGNVLTGRPVTWYTNEAWIASVDNTGRVTGINAGNVVLVAYAEGHNASAPVTITQGAPPPPPPPPPPTAPVASISITPTSGSLAVGQSLQFTATTRDAAGNVLTGRPVTWYTNEAWIASVDNTGRVTGINAGNVVLVAYSEGHNASAPVTITQGAPPPPPPPPPPTAPVASISITPTSGSLAVGQTLQFTATTRDAAGNVLTGRPVTWYTNESWIASADNTGRVTGINAGNVVLVAYAEGHNASAPLTITQGAPPPPAPVATVTLAPATASVQIGQTVQLTPTLRDAAGNVLTGRAVTWTTSNAAVATVSSAGLVNGVGAGGPVTITGTSEGRSGTAQVTVTAAPAAPVATVTVAPATGSIGTGQTLQLAATLRDAAGNVLTGRTIVWTSSNAGLASVSSSGRVTGVAAGGPVTITATSEGRSGSAAVTITAPPPPPPPAPVATVSLAPATASVSPGQSVQLTPTLRDAAGNTLTGRVITWASSNSAVATVSPSGLVMGIATGGPVTITATSEGRSGTAAVTVTTPSAATTLFESDWRTAVGTGTTALRDGTKWTAWVNYGGPQLLSVVSASGMGFPAAMTNVLRVLQAGESDAEHMQLQNGLPLPQVGDHIYYRIYTRVDEASQAGHGSDHPVEPIPGSCPFLWTFKRSISANGWTPEWQFGNTPSEEWWSLRMQLQKNVVYRIEWHFHFITASTFKFDTRIYDAAGTLLYTDVDFLSGNFLNQTLQARDPNFRNTDNACFRNLFVGNNGQASWTNTNTYTYWGGVKVCKDGWCGAY